MLERAKIVSVSGNYADITKDGVSILRRIPVVGDASTLIVNQQVFVSYVDNRMVILTGGAASGVSAASSGDGMVPHPMSYHTDAISWHVGLSGTQLHNPKAHASTHLSGGSDSVDHNSLANYDANRHIDHTAVTLTAGAGLTGGGDISASRTLAVGAGTLITVGEDTVGITPGASYQFIGTSDGTAAAWQNLSTLAGAGLTHATGILAVGAGDGIDVAADNVAVDVTDIIDTNYGLTENSNNIQINIGTGMAFSSGALYAYGLRQSDYGANALVADANGDLTAYGGLAFNVAESITTNAGDLTINPAVKLVVLSDVMLDGDSRIYEEYTSGYFGAGYAIGYDGTKSYLEVDDLTVRHTLRTHIFQYDIVRATNGYLYIADASEITQPASGSYIYVKEPVFAIGDLLWYKDYDLDDTLTISSVQMTVTAGPTVVTNNGVDHQRYTVTADSGSLADLSAGGTVVRVGNTTDTDRQGALYMDASSTFSPFMDVIDGVNSWSAFGAAAKTKVRLGNLEGITSDAEYGLWAGEGTGVGDSYLLISNVNVELHDIPMFFYDSGNNQRVGIVPDAGSTDKLWWAGESESNPGLVVYGDGDVWLSTLAISEQMGDMLFSQADGLALWGPGCAITPTSWTSTRGKVATISGAFHQVQGPWANSKALVVEPAATNLVKNPRPFSATGWCTWQSSGSSTVTFVGDESFPGIGKAANAFNFVSTPDSSFWFATISITNGTTYSVTFWIKTTVARDVEIVLSQNSSPWGRVSVETPVVTSQTYWAKHTVTLTSTATLVDDARIMFSGGACTDVTFYLANVQVEGGTHTSYIDGDLGIGYTWNGDGTPHANTSTRAATLVTFTPQSAIDLGDGSVSIWFQMPYDAGTAASVTRGLFRWWDAWNTESFYIEFAADLSAVGLTSYVSGALNTHIYADLTGSKAGDWHQIVVTVNATAGAKVYLDGVLHNSDATWWVGLISSTTAYIGYVNEYFGGAIAEFATFRRALSAEEVAGLYAQSKPLADAGASRRPGIYIMDGEIDLRTSQTGARVQIDVDGIGGYSATTTKTFSLETDGDLFLGSNISAAATTAFSVFALAQTYNGESMGAGDVLLGDNSAGKINLLWDVSEGDVILRRGNGVGSARISLDGSSDSILIGQVDSNQNNILITNGAISIRNDDVERVGITAAGVLTIKDSSGAAVFTFDASAGAEFTLPLTLATTGGIYQGTGSFASPTTGLKLWNDSGVGRIAGYNTGVAQWYVDTSGVFNVGGGRMTLKATGMWATNASAADAFALSLTNGNSWGGWTLDTGDFSVGRSTGGYLRWDDSASTMYLKGSIVITGGSGIGSLSDAGDLATADDLDDVADGSTYKKLYATDISSGHIKLTTYTVIDGDWYDESGVDINASTGITIYGSDSAFTTRATKTGTIECKVDSAGAIVAGAGAVKLDSTGIKLSSGTLATNTLKWYDGTTMTGYINVSGAGESFTGLDIQVNDNVYYRTGWINLLANSEESISRKAQLYLSAGASPSVQITTGSTIAAEFTSSLVTIGTALRINGQTDMYADLYMHDKDIYNVDKLSFNVVYTSHPSAPSTGIMLYSGVIGGVNGLFAQWGDGHTQVVVAHT